MKIMKITIIILNNENYRRVDKKKKEKLNVG